MDVETARRIIEGLRAANESVGHDSDGYCGDYFAGHGNALVVAASEIFNLPVDEYADLINELLFNRGGLNEDALRWVASGV